uniref:C2H2-type domain-containing protein n=1 Tax=Caenorhabditis japonica TaxID=281687 RepID=A0A8R1HRN0_CAEJA
MDGSTGFTCVTCRVVFETAELQRDHYKSDWHRYNLKRMAAELPAIGFETFTEKSTLFNPVKQVAVEIEPLYCKACRKSIKSENAMTDHLTSKKHKENEKKSQEAEKKGPKQPRKKAENLPKKAESVEENEDGDSSGWETDDGEDEEGIETLNDEDALPVTSCLFCPQTKPSMAEMQEHMNFHHGFQLPDRKYLVDEVGCLNYLGLKVGAGRCCIYCPDVKARYASVDSCQQHMRDKEHCKLRRDPESMIELGDFYDYTAMYEGEDAEKSELFDDGWSLTLPSGAQIGHRSLHRYFKQYLRPVDGTQRLVSRAAIDKAKGFYPALAWTGTTTVEAKKVARDMKFVERFKRRFDLRVAVKSNKLFKTNGFVGDNH